MSKYTHWCYCASVAFSKPQCVLQYGINLHVHKCHICHIWPLNATKKNEYWLSPSVCVYARKTSTYLKMKKKNNKIKLTGSAYPPTSGWPWLQLYVVWGGGGGGGGGSGKT